MKKAIITLLLVIFTLPSFASHFAGGEIYYNWNGTNYTVTLKLYRPCIGGSAGLPISVTAIVQSKTRSVYKRVAMGRVKLEAAAPRCPVKTACEYRGSSVFGFEIATYQDTVSLPSTAPDWVFSWRSGARSITSNTQGGANIYLEATLDNTNGNNSIAYTPNTPPFLIGSVSNKIALQTLDYDGDSLVFERTVPMIDSVTYISYVVGYSFANPLGANVPYAISPNGDTLEVGVPNQGSFNLAYRVKEYRNGVLIASHIRDFSVSKTIGSAVMNIDYPTLTYGVTDLYICPGRIQNVTLGFADANNTDSVLVKMETPTVGWNITSVNTPGKGTGNIQIGITAPATLNPQKLPFFYLNVKVYNGGCKRDATKYAILVRTRVCNTDSVWAGDANGDKVVNLLDPLALALSYGHIGTSRNPASISWVPEYSTDWGTNIPFTATDEKHADCNGDGTINATDLIAISSNWSRTHPKGTPQRKTTAGHDLYFDLSGLTFAPGVIVEVPIRLGNTSSVVSNFYGLSSRVGVTLNASVPSNQISVSPSTSWVGGSGNTLEFNKVIDNGTIDWAYARNNQQGVTGSGIVGKLRIDIPSTAVDGDRIDMTFRSTTIIDATGRVLTGYNTMDTFAYIWPLKVADVASTLNDVKVVPNPSKKSAVLQLTLAQAQMLNVAVTDVTGKSIWTVSQSFEKGAHQISLPASELPSGIYMIRLVGDAGISTTLKWVKQ